LALAERDLALVADELVHAADDLLGAAASVAGDMEAKCDEESGAAEEAARVHLSAAIDALDRCGEAEGRASWWAELGREGAVAPYRAGGVSRDRQMRVRAAIAYLDEHREKAAAHVARVAAFNAAEAKLPLPPEAAPAPGEPVAS
jgi:hypothetical protein